MSFFRPFLDKDVLKLVLCEQQSAAEIDVAMLPLYEQIRSDQISDLRSDQSLCDLKSGGVLGSSRGVRFVCRVICLWTAAFFLLLGQDQGEGSLQNRR